MNRLSWDSTALRRTRPPRPHVKEDETQLPHDDLLQPAWREIRRIHRF
jgi:hypothetical protein